MPLARKTDCSALAAVAVLENMPKWHATVLGTGTGEAQHAFVASRMHCSAH